MKIPQGTMRIAPATLTIRHCLRFGESFGVIIGQWEGLEGKTRMSGMLR